jgi:hypothetical protein
MSFVITLCHKEYCEKGGPCDCTKAVITRSTQPAVVKGVERPGSNCSDAKYLASTLTIAGRSTVYNLPNAIMGVSQVQEALRTGVLREVKAKVADPINLTSAADVAPINLTSPADVAPINLTSPADVAPINLTSPADVAPIDLTNTAKVAPASSNEGAFGLDGTTEPRSQKRVKRVSSRDLGEK